MSSFSQALLQQLQMHSTGTSSFAAPTPGSTLAPLANLPGLTSPTAASISSSNLPSINGNATVSPSLNPTSSLPVNVTTASQSAASPVVAQPSSPSTGTRTFCLGSFLLPTDCSPAGGPPSSASTPANQSDWLVGYNPQVPRRITVKLDINIDHASVVRCSSLAR